MCKTQDHYYTYYIINYYLCQFMHYFWTPVINLLFKSVFNFCVVKEHSLVDAYFLIYVFVTRSFIIYVIMAVN